MVSGKQFAAQAAGQLMAEVYEVIEPWKHGVLRQEVAIKAKRSGTSGNRAKASRSLIMEVSAPAVRPSRGREQLSGKLPATEARHAALDLS